MAKKKWLKTTSQQIDESVKTLKYLAKIERMDGTFPDSKDQAATLAIHQAMLLVDQLAGWAFEHEMEREAQAIEKKWPEDFYARERAKAAHRLRLLQKAPALHQPLQRLRLALEGLNKKKPSMLLHIEEAKSAKALKRAMPDIRRELLEFLYYMHGVNGGKLQSHLKAIADAIGEEPDTFASWYKTKPIEKDNMLGKGMTLKKMDAIAERAKQRGKMVAAIAENANSDEADEYIADYYINVKYSQERLDKLIEAYWRYKKYKPSAS